MNQFPACTSKLTTFIQQLLSANIHPQGHFFIQTRYNNAIMRQAVKFILWATIMLVLVTVIPSHPVSAQEEQDTAVPLAPVITSTPGQDGIIIHTVQYGETLYTISEAYGVPIDQILRNTGLPLSTTEILAGQELLIQTASEPSPTPTNTPTEDPGTPTPTQPRPTMTPFPTRTPAPTYTPTTPPSMIHRTLGDAKGLGIALILISGFGLILVIYLGFIKKS